ncbi:adenylyl cyclase-associated protein Cap1 [Schizosaccharomyces japonicus yFS275]|uniref:Adenylyl cyclase-associated protein n=1 Tax=Schizosaccharomyces japonicus (strain yFS275 / FY16936) TaxID=402676 RepID=B6JYT5_SCHJY|nr:adenylyl cyclase-associated protein Cap1 [Schizosaccharomyces japonicus yFS275]EEB06703.1 adenylyl cyclase-associated protein Cap1 [Schizosaccharomyces japonicus yFS275]
MADLSNIRETGYNFTTILKRLEAATSRLEDLVEIGRDSSLSQQEEPSETDTTPKQASVAAPVPEKAQTEPKADLPQLPKSVSDYDAYCKTHLTPYLQLSKKIGGLIEKQSEHVDSAFQKLRDILQLSSLCKKPVVTSPEYTEMLKPVQQELLGVTKIRDENRNSPQFNQLSMVMDGISILGWVTVEPAPLGFMGEMKDSAQYYANRVLTEVKNKDQTQVEWVRSYLKLLSELQVYVKEHFKTGLQWSTDASAADLATKLKDLKLEDSTAPSSAASSASVPPPPPPPAPTGNYWEKDDDTTPKPASSKPNLGAVFAEINQGEGITAGLRKVDKSQMTHKNPELRKQPPPVAPKPASPGSHAVKKSPAPAPSKPPRLELENTKWFVENQTDNHNIILENVELNHTVQIFNCNNCTIIIKGKLNAVSMSRCKRTSVVVDTLVASLDIANCANFGCQIMEKVPMVVIDKCDGGSIFVSKQSLDTEFVTSCTTSLNINIPTDDGDYKECAMPEMLKHTVNEKGEFVTEVIRHE